MHLFRANYNALGARANEPPVKRMARFLRDALQDREHWEVRNE